jgi:hypothetical protein
MNIIRGKKDKIRGVCDNDNGGNLKIYFWTIQTILKIFKEDKEFIEEAAKKFEESNPSK